MCPHDPADSFSVTNGDDPTPVRPRHPAADATSPGDSDQADVTLPARSNGEASATVGRPVIGTMDRSRPT